MTKIRRVDLWPDDALTGTLMLSDAEMGVYVRIWLLIYSTGGPIQIDHLRSVCRSHGNAFNHIMERLEKLGKIQRNGREIDQKRCRNELEKALKLQRKAAENAAKRWKNNNLHDADALLPSNASPRVTSTPTPTIKKDSEAIASGVAEAPPDPIEDLWNRGKAVLGNSKSAGSLIGKLRKQHGDVVVLQAIVTAEAELPSDPASFLVGCCNRAKANGHGQRKLSPGEKLFLGFAQAAEGDFGADSEAPQPLLDRRR